MERSSPWSNKLKITNLSIIDKLYPVALDKWRKIILGSRFPLGHQKTTIMVGTDVSGEIHLGHVALFCVADLMRVVLNGKVTVSINELESILSRNRQPKLVVTHQKKFIEIFKASGCSVHSRLSDPILVLFSTYLWNHLLTNKSRHGLFKYYEHQLSPQDVLSVAIMASTPIVLATKEGRGEVLAIYGVDEFAHLELINRLYRSAWFRREVKKFFGTEPPKFNYLLIKTLPDKTGKYKMSKSRPLTTIFVKEISKKTIIKENCILEYLEKLSSLIKEESGGSAHKNIWYNIIEKIQNEK